MLKLMFVLLANLAKNISMTFQAWGSPKGQLMPIRVEVRAKHPRHQTRR